MESENDESTTKFFPLIKDLKKVIFSYLNPNDQRKIYWSSKKLRSLLPDSPLMININSFKKRISYPQEDSVIDILELIDGTVACSTTECVYVLDLNNYNLDVITEFPIKSTRKNSILFPLCHYENIITVYPSGQLIILNRNFVYELIETFNKTNYIRSLCNISQITFAYGNSSGIMKIFNKNEITGKYEIYKEFNYHSYPVLSLLYIAKYDVLLSGSLDTTIHALNLSEGKSILRLRDHTQSVSSLISLDEDSFSSGCKDGVIKFWYIKKNNTGALIIECIKTIQAHVKKELVYLSQLGNNFLVSRQLCCVEFKIWNVKTFECMKIYKERFTIEDLIVTKSNCIITKSFNCKRINVWKIHD